MTCHLAATLFASYLSSSVLPVQKWQHHVCNVCVCCTFLCVYVYVCMCFVNVCCECVCVYMRIFVCLCGVYICVYMCMHMLLCSQ